MRRIVPHYGEEMKHIRARKLRASMPALSPHLQTLARQLCSIIQNQKRSIGNQLMMPFCRLPGPRNCGIIGDFPLGSRDPLGLYTQWARQYGDIFYYRAFNRHIYFLNRPDLIEQVLVSDYRSFIKGEALQFNRRIFGNGLLTNEGDSWLRQRHLIQPAFHRDRIASYGNTIVAYTERMMAAWQDGEVRDIHRT